MITVSNLIVNKYLKTFLVHNIIIKKKLRGIKIFFFKNSHTKSSIIANQFRF